MKRDNQTVLMEIISVFKIRECTNYQITFACNLSTKQTKEALSYLQQKGIIEEYSETRIAYQKGFFKPFTRQRRKPRRAFRLTALGRETAGLFERIREIFAESEPEPAQVAYAVIPN